MDGFCLSKNILPKNSYAYQKNKNTIGAIEKVIETIMDNKRNKFHTVAFYLK